MRTDLLLTARVMQGRPSQPDPAPKKAQLEADVPKDAYGAPPSGSVRITSGTSWVLAQQGQEPIGTKLRHAFRDLLLDEKVHLDPRELLVLQAIAIRALQTVFTNQFHTDGALLAALGAKGSMTEHHPGEEIARAVLRPRGTRDLQLDCLNLLARTMRSADDSDLRLRLAIFEKLGALGRREDIAALLPHVRKGVTTADLFHAEMAIRAITQRTGAPVARTRLLDDPEIGPLLRKDKLTNEERNQVIEEVLKRGEIERIEKLDTGQYHAAVVYVVRFKDRLPGEPKNIRAAYKPEMSWPGKSECWYSREVLAYTLDRDFVKTGLIPPTVESMIELDKGAGCRVGSLSFWEPRCQAFGHRPPDRAWDGTVPPDQIPPRFQHLPNEAWFQKRMGQVRTLAYILNNDDLVANNLNPRNNFANILIVEDLQGAWDVRVIDWSSAAGGNRNSGAGNGTINDGFLPQDPAPETKHALETADEAQVAGAVREMVKDHDADNVGSRVRQADKRLRKNG